MMAALGADVVLVGTWTHGLFVVGQTPFALGNIANLPTMRGKKAACFLTFALNASVDAVNLGMIGWICMAKKNRASFTNMPVKNRRWA